MQKKCDSCIYTDTSECETCANVDHDVGTADRDYHLSDHYTMDCQGDEYFESIENGDNFNGEFL